MKQSKDIKVAKVYFPSGEIRRISIKERTLIDLKDLLSYPRLSEVQYSNNEKWVPICSEEAWKEACSNKTSVLRLRVVMYEETEYQELCNYEESKSSLSNDFFVIPLISTN
jgi:hypothetical protein